LIQRLVSGVWNGAGPPETTTVGLLAVRMSIHQTRMMMTTMMMKMMTTKRTRMNTRLSCM
jgi:hypothetical protein